MLFLNWVNWFFIKISTQIPGTNQRLNRPGLKCKTMAVDHAEKLHQHIGGEVHNRLILKRLLSNLQVSKIRTES